MNEWMDGWMNGWMDEWMGGWMDGWIFESFGELIVQSALSIEWAHIYMFYSAGLISNV